MIKILSKDNDLIGTDTYRDDTKAIPLAYRHTIAMSINPNASGSNNMVTVKSVRPVVITAADGKVSSSDSFLGTFKFSALQHVTNDVERALCYDKLLEFLKLPAVRTAILDGQLTDEPVTFTA